MAFKRTTRRFRRRYRRRPARKMQLAPRKSVLGRYQRGLGPALLNPFPQRRYVKLRYVQEYTLDPSSGTPVYQVFVCNGLYDPDATGTGHQPMFFDQLTAIYNHYEVYGSKITAKFLPNGSSSAYVGIYMDDNATSSSVLTTLIEQGPTVNHKVLLSTSSRPVVVKKTWSQRKVFGASARGTYNLIGTSASNPPEKSYFMTWAAGVNSGDPAAITVLVTMDFFCVFTEVQTITSS